MIQAPRRLFSPTSLSIRSKLLSQEKIEDRLSERCICRMAKRSIFRRMRRKSGVFVYVRIGFLFFLASTVLPACSVNIFGSCSGVGITCNNPQTSNNATIEATAQAIAKSKPLASDPLSKQDSNSWAKSSGCAFRNNAYVVTETTASSIYFCDTDKLYFSDATFQVDVTLQSGNAAGILFRANYDLSEGYVFQISDSSFDLEYLYSGGSNLVISPTGSSAINAGGQNTLMVIANLNDFRLFINETFVGEAQDSILSAGYVGFTVLADQSGTAATASFTNLVIYES